MSEIDALRTQLAETQQERDELRWQLDDIRRQMEEARAAGDWPLVKVVGERDVARASLAATTKALKELLAYVPERGATIRAGYGPARARAVAVLSAAGAAPAGEETGQ